MEVASGSDEDIEPEVSEPRSHIVPAEPRQTREHVRFRQSERSESENELRETREHVVFRERDPINSEDEPPQTRDYVVYRERVRSNSENGPRQIREHVVVERERSDSKNEPRAHRGHRERSQRTRPVGPTERIEQFYGNQRMTPGLRPSVNMRSSNHQRIGSKPEPLESSDRKPARSGKPGFEELHMSAARKPGLEPRISHVQTTGDRRRRSSRLYATSSQAASPGNLGLDQNANEMLDDYYDGFDDNDLPNTTSMGLHNQYGPGHALSDFNLGKPPPRPHNPFAEAVHVSFNEQAVPMSFNQPPQPPPPPTPPRPTGFSGSPPPGRPEGISSGALVRPSKRSDYIIRAPYQTAIWDRAAVWNQVEQKYDLQLKLVLTRHGERYSSDNFPYRSGTWTDIVFAHKLNEQYHSLKTAKVGILQKLTAYKKISFVYFIQFHAFPDVRYPSTGAWLRTDRKPITFRDNPMTRNSFMNQLRRLCTKRSILYSTLTGAPRDPPDERPQIRWVSRLDDLIEPGAVIDIDVKETFDSMTIYAGLFFAIILSFAAALGYGFAMQGDFSTGFSLASWMITALGFFAAVVAAGEYIGLDSPKATLMDADGRERPWL